MITIKEWGCFPLPDIDGYNHTIPDVDCCLQAFKQSYEFSDESSNCSNGSSHDYPYTGKLATCLHDDWKTSESLQNFVCDSVKMSTLILEF